MRIVVVPDTLHAEINRALDAALSKAPGAEPDRELFYEQLLAFFDEHGVLPEFSLVRDADAAQA